ncbi:hypothetical protein EDB87DRAFT_1658994 [Lactarius vividus]|nr:hypothetical protein EDB87DRAFT_1658994 [Lactarius vividus]
MFPAVRTLRVFEPKPMRGPLSELVEFFTTMRRHSGHRVHVYYALEPSSCKICRASFTQQEELKKHLVVWHAYRIVCPYCGDFEFTPRYSDLFREHLASKHSEVPHAEALVSNPALQSSSTSNAGSHGTRHNDLRASVIFERFIEFKAPEIPDGLQTQPDAVYFLRSISP